jgi:hypothetical protein
MLASHGLRERERERERETRNLRAEAKTKERRCAPETQEEGKHALTTSETLLGLGLGLPCSFLTGHWPRCDWSRWITGVLLRPERSGGMAATNTRNPEGIRKYSNTVHSPF